MAEENGAADRQGTESGVESPGSALEGGERYLAQEACEVGYLYQIDGRNASLGIYDGQGEFLLRRYKFGDVFIDQEDHWDHDNGTVRPIRKLCKVPEDVWRVGNMFQEARLIAWLEEQGMKLPEEHEK